LGFLAAQQRHGPRAALPQEPFAVILNSGVPELPSVVRSFLLGLKEADY
jgi:hypothetical protein